MKLNAIKLIVVIAMVSVLSARPLAEQESNKVQEFNCFNSDGFLQCDRTVKEAIRTRTELDADTDEEDK